LPAIGEIPSEASGGDAVADVKGRRASGVLAPIVAGRGAESGGKALGELQPGFGGPAGGTAKPGVAVGETKVRAEGGRVGAEAEFALKIEERAERESVVEREIADGEGICVSAGEEQPVAGECPGIGGLEGGFENGRVLPIQRRR